MCNETPAELLALLRSEQERHLNAFNSKDTKAYDKWWHGIVIGWYEAVEGNVAKSRTLLGLPECNCPKKAPSESFPE